MAAARRLWFRIRSLARRGRLERELDDELRMHLELEAEKNQAAGMSPDEARRAARISLGGVDQTKERVRDAWGATAVEGLRQDVRDGLRSIRHNLAFAAAVVLTLGLGIGANTAIFSVVNGVLLRPLPYGEPKRLVVVRQSLTTPATPNLGFSEKELLDYRDASGALEDLVEYHTMSFTLLGGDEAEHVQTGVPLAQTQPFNRGFRIEGRPAETDARPSLDYRIVSSHYFETIGQRVVSGRGFEERDESESRQVAVVNQAFARRYWGDGDPVGQRIGFGDADPEWITIVGVVGNVRYYGLDSEPTLELYRPFDQDPGWGAILLGIFALVALLITAAGIGGVLALSVSQRTLEIGVRMAMGAERRSVMGMVLRQGLGLVLAGLALGVAGAIVLSRLVERLLFGVPPTDPLTYAAVAVLLVGVASAACLLPARRAASVDPLVALRHA